MTPMKLQIGLARFPYAGNGGIESEHPSIAPWIVRLSKAIEKDPRCHDKLWTFCRGDTPIPMMRNRACRLAQEAGVDVLLMVDSDQVPDLYLGRLASAKPFFESSFDFLYRERYGKGPCVIVAPYCGPEPDPVYGGLSNVYVFRWGTCSNNPIMPGWKVDQFTREEAQRWVGISEVAAGPTGLVMMDMRLFERKPKPWFYYEYKDEYESEKVSTEDVTFTRDCSLLKIPIFCNWDAWAGHAKPTIVGKPALMTVDDVRESFREALGRGSQPIREINPGKSVAEILAAQEDAA